MLCQATAKIIGIITTIQVLLLNHINAEDKCLFSPMPDASIAWRTLFPSEEIESDTVGTKFREFVEAITSGDFEDFHNFVEAMRLVNPYNILPNRIRIFMRYKWVRFQENDTGYVCDRMFFNASQEVYMIPENVVALLRQYNQN